MHDSGLKASLLTEYEKIWSTTLNLYISTKYPLMEKSTL